MSASPIARQATGLQGIPTRRIVINHENEMPSDYGTTPGGTLFGTTPGGTRIVYERAFLMQMRGSPLARTPPTNLPVIPGVTAPSEPKQGGGKKKDSPSKDSNKSSNGREASPTKNRVHEVIKEEDDQFAMDM